MFFRPEKEPFSVVRNDDLIILENQYLKCVHDLKTGGTLSEVIVKNGSGRNLFAHPQAFLIVTYKQNQHHVWQSGPAEFYQSEHDRNPVLNFTSCFHDRDGRKFDHVKLHLQVEYTGWGEVRFHAVIDASERIFDIRQLQISSLYPTRQMNCLAVQKALPEVSDPYRGNCVLDWIDLKPVPHKIYHHSRYIPLSMLVFRKGLEGFQVTLGDDLCQWDSIPSVLPGMQSGFFGWTHSMNSFEMLFAPIAYWRKNQYIEGKLPFDFSIAFPFVREKVVPLSPCSGNILYRNRGFEKRWPREEDLKDLKHAGVTLMRLHNDGDDFKNGIFWRDAAYPPYPPAEMKKMDRMLKQAAKYKINVVPYFSLHEFHPEAAGFKRNAERWGRIAVKGDDIIPSFSSHGYFGFQMCLESGWFKKRIDTIDEVLSKHAFNGVYYDWCSSKECLNGKHKKRHWDYRKLIALLEWSRSRVGKDGAVYLHQTRNPNILAENLATLILTEETGGTVVYPEMFSPHAHFMNIVPRQVCLMIPESSPEKNLRRYAMCALLHHATVSSGNKVFTAFYHEQAELMRECVNYRRHTAPGEGLCGTSLPEVGMSVYWNDDEAMAVFANLSEGKQTAAWHFNPEDGQELKGRVTVGPLSIKIVKKPFRKTGK